MNARRQVKLASGPTSSSAVTPSRRAGSAESPAFIPLFPRLTFADDGGSFRFDQRAEPRRSATGEHAATYSDGGSRFGLARIRMTDRSMTGIGLLSATPIAPGMLVTICPEGSRVPMLAGIAVRCEQVGSEYRIGLRLARTLAA